MICTTYFLTFFSELIPPTGYTYLLFYSIIKSLYTKATRRLLSFLFFFLFRRSTQLNLSIQHYRTIWRQRLLNLLNNQFSHHLTHLL